MISTYLGCLSSTNLFNFLHLHRLSNVESSLRIWDLISGDYYTVSYYSMQILIEFQEGLTSDELASRQPEEQEPVQVSFIFVQLYIF